MEARAIKIKSIKRITKTARVYDLTVEGRHNFVAAGVVVHNCGFGCKYCIPSSAKVLMADGTEKHAGRVRIGDRVMSYNTETGKPEVAVVEETMSRKAESLIRIKTASAKLAVTPEHPVFTKRGWVRADELTTDDEVVVW